MPTIAIVDGIRVVIFLNDHDPPHFHAFLGEHRLRIEIVSGLVIGAHGPVAMERKLAEWASRHEAELLEAWQDARQRAFAAEDRMMKDTRVEGARAIDGRHVLVRWNDGLEAVLDFDDLVRAGGAYAPLADASIFADVRIYDYGHGIYWPGPDGTEIDICPDLLRVRADPKAAAWVAEQEDAWHARHAAK